MEPEFLKGLRAGQRVTVTIRSSSSAPQGIAEVSNLSGSCGPGTYPTTYFKTYAFDVVADGEASWTNSGGVVVQSVAGMEVSEDIRDQVATPLIEVDGKRVSLRCETPAAVHWHSMVDHSGCLG